MTNIINNFKEKLTDEEVSEIINLYWINKDSITKIATKYGLKFRQVRSILIENDKFDENVSIKFSPEDENKIILFYKNGDGIFSIAKKLCMHPDDIKKCLIKNGQIIRHFKKINLNENQEKEIIEKYKNGMGLAKIAKYFNCSIKPILRILNKNGIYRKNYRNTRKIHEYHSAKHIFPSVLFSNQKSSAHRLGRIWDITKDDIDELYKKQNGLCYYTKIPMVTCNHPVDYEKIMKNNPRAMSIDRIDSSKNYTKDNIALCCRFINYAKNNYSSEQVFEILKEISNTLK